MAKIDNAADLPDPVTNREASRLILAAVLHGSEGVPEDDLLAILNAYRAHRVMGLVWDLVLGGEVGVQWDATAHDVVFHHLDEDERRKRQGALARVE